MDNSSSRRHHARGARGGSRRGRRPELTAIVNLYFVDDIDSGLFGLGCGAPVFSGYYRGEVSIIISDETFS